MELTKENTAYLATVSPSLSLEVGDTKQDTFIPQVKLLAWENEANFSARLSTPEKGTDKTATVNEKTSTVNWEGDKKSVAMYGFGKDGNHPEGGFELEVFLSEKPASNVLTFTLQHKNIAAHYQPPLTELVGTEGIATATDTEGFDENGKRICQRPENVVGSYAIYHAAPPLNFLGGKEYKAGKICHIYRPKAIDAMGTETWCDLSIDLNAATMTVTIPELFFDSAVFPVAVDPTFGYTTVGGTSVNFNAAGSLCHIGSGLVYSPTVNYNRITKFSIYASNDGTAGSVGLAAYDISGGLPVNRVAAALTVTLSSGTAAWLDTAATAQTLTNGNTYGTCEGAAVHLTCYFDTGTGSQRSAASGNFPNPWSSTGTSAALYSWYATYETVRQYLL
jgi:hypothetical protein